MFEPSIVCKVGVERTTSEDLTEDLPNSPLETFSARFTGFPLPIGLRLPPTALST